MRTIRRTLLAAAMTAGVLVVPCRAEETEVTPEVPEGICLPTDRVWEYYYEEDPETVPEEIVYDLALYRFVRHDYRQGRRYEVFQMVHRTRYVPHVSSTGQVTYEQDEEAEPLATQYFLREEQGKVYWLMDNEPSPTPPVREKLVYDFNLTEGETIGMTPNPKSYRKDLREIPVTVKDPVTIEGREC